MIHSPPHSPLRSSLPTSRVHATCHSDLFFIMCVYMCMCLVTCTDNLKPKIYMNCRCSPTHNWFDITPFDFIVVWKRYALINVWSVHLSWCWLVAAASVSHQPCNHEGQLPIHLERLDPAAVVFPLSTLFNKWHGLPGGASLPANAGDIRDVGSSPALKRSPWKEEMATCSSILA